MLDFFKRAKMNLVGGWIWLIFSFMGSFASAAIPIITSPADNTGQNYQAPITVGYTVADLSFVNLAIYAVGLPGVPPVYQTSFFPTATSGNWIISAGTIPSSRYLTRLAITLEQRGQQSAPTYFTVTAPPSFAGYQNATTYFPLGSDVVITFTANFNQTVTLDAHLGPLRLSLSQSLLTGAFYAFSGSFTLPAAQITQAGMLLFTLSQSGYSSSTYTINIGSPPAGAAPSIISPPYNVNQNLYPRIYPLDQPFTVTYVAASDHIVSTTSSSGYRYVEDSSFATYSASSTPILTGGVYIGSFTVPASIITSSGYLVMNLQQDSRSSILTVSWTFGGAPVITGYNSAASTYSANDIPSISCISNFFGFFKYFQTVLTETTTGDVNTQYYAWTYVYQDPVYVYVSGAFSPKIVSRYAYPVAGSYSLVASANGYDAPAITFTIINPAPPTISSPQSNAVITLSASSPAFSIAYTAPTNYLQPIQFNLTGTSSSFTATSTPLASGAGSFKFPSANTIASGIYALTAQQMTPDGENTGTVSVSNIQINSVNDPAIAFPSNSSTIDLNSALKITYSSAASLQKAVVVTLKKPDGTLIALTDTPPAAGGGTIIFPADNVNHIGIYTVTILQTIDTSTTLTGLPVLLLAGTAPVISAIVNRANYTQDLAIFPIIQYPTATEVTTISVSLTYSSGAAQTTTYPFVDLGNGTSEAGPIKLNRPYNFNGVDSDFASLGAYTLTVAVNGISSDPISYVVEAANAPTWDFPVAGDEVTVSTANPFNVTYGSPANYNMLVTASLTLMSNSGARKMRRAGPIIATNIPDAAGGGTITFDGPNAVTLTGDYELTLSQAAPDGSSVSSDPADFHITVLAASGAAGGNRKAKRRLLRRSRCSKPETECPTASGGFECIDIGNELTSCGGCNADGKATSEYDCTLIQRAKGVGCQKGQCVVFSCEGFSYRPNLDRSACVRA